MHTKTNQIWLWVFAYISHCIAPVFLYDLELFRTRIKNKKSFANKTSYLNNDYCIRAQFVCNSIEGAFLCMQNIYGWKFANAKWKLQQWSVVVIFFCIVFLIFFFIPCLVHIMDKEIMRTKIRPVAIKQNICSQHGKRMRFIKFVRKSTRANIVKQF